MAPIGKAVIVTGLMLAAVGALLWGTGRAPLLGRLPGDIYLRRGAFSFYFPLATCVLLSVVLTLIFAIFWR